MPTFIIANDENFSRPIILASEDEKHLLKSLRAKTGDVIFLCNNSGKILEAKILTTKPLTFEKIKISETLKPHALTVYFPIIDFDRMEWAIEKLTELNVQTIQLMLTARTQGKTFSKNKMERLERIARSAQIQSGRGYPLVIHDPEVFESLLKKENSLKIFGDLRNENLSDAEKNRMQSAKEKSLWIGPEGGWTENEIALLKKCDAIAIHLSGNILRAETAALALTATICK